MRASSPPTSLREKKVHRWSSSRSLAHGRRREPSPDKTSQKKRSRRNHGGAPTWLTYGEFDLDGFFELLRAAAPREGETFVDVGSGCGRLVLAAALVHNWRACVGIEMLGDLHELATKSHTKLVAASADLGLQLAPCELVCDEADSALPRAREGRRRRRRLRVRDVLAVGGAAPHALSETLAGALPDGSRVITVDKQLVSDDASGGGRLRLRRARVVHAQELQHSPVERVGVRLPTDGRRGRGRPKLRSALRSFSFISAGGYKMNEARAHTHGLSQIR